MLAEKQVQEECLYCHGQMKLGNPCSICGDAKRAESLRPDPSAQPTPMFPPRSRFESQIAGV